MATVSKSYNLRDPNSWKGILNPLNWFGGGGGFLRPDTNQVQAAVSGTRIKADEDLSLSLPRAQSSSHSMCLNSPFARSVLRGYRTGVLGSDGIVLRSEIRRRNKNRNEKTYKLNEPLNKKVEKAWKDWGRAASVCGELSWLDIQKQVLNTIIESGDCLVMFLPIAPSNNAKNIKSNVMLSIQVIEGDMIDVSYSGSRVASANEYWEDGIKYDRLGRKLAYAIQTKITERLYETREYDARDILHLYFRSEQRAGSKRGWPLLTSVRNAVPELDRYIQASVDFQQSNSATVAFVSPSPSSTPPAPLSAADVDAITEAPARGGGIRLLPSGATVHERGHVQAGNIIPFVNATEEMVSMASGLTKDLVTGNMSETNLASGRLGQILSNEQFKEKQQFLIENLHEPTRIRFIKAWLLVERGTDVPTNLDEYKHSWITRTYPVSDDLKKANADKANLELGIKSRTRLANEQGIDWEAEIKQRAKEEEILAENNITLPPVATETIAVEEERNPLNQNQDGSNPGDGGGQGGTL